MRKVKALFASIVIVLAGLGALHAGALEQRTERDQVASQSVTEKVVFAYTSQIGVHEATGHNDGVQVEEYLRVAGFKKGAAWCASFVSWSFKQANAKAIISAWAPSWFPVDHVIYEKGKPVRAVPRQADVFGIYFPDKGRIAHVGFIDNWPPGDYLLTVEGNTNNAGSREGDGVYRKRRLKSNIYKVSRWTST
jgi:hypothetical protein